jgi:N-acetylmuramoyl-L-alanine amidase
MQRSRFGWFTSWLGLALIAFPSVAAHATDDSVPNDPLGELNAGVVAPLATLSPAEGFRRMHLVLGHFQVPAEPAPDFSALDGHQSLAGLTSALRTIDPKAQWPRFARTQASRLEVFQDRDGYGVPDFTVKLGADEALPPTRLDERLRQARTNPPTRPLAGLRIALDPGHMGGSPWDERTGKFVRAQGHILSEGVMALQVALLLERELTALGAEVLLTHRSLGPATDTAWGDLDIPTFGRIELRQSTLQPWFQSLLASGGTDSALLKTFDQSSRTRALFSESARGRYFILRDDLDARVRKVRAFDPDLTIIIHFDVAPGASGDGNGLNPNAPRWTKSYVAGSTLVEEFASRADRAELAAHMLDPLARQASIRLSQTLVGHLKEHLGLGYDPNGGDNAVPVAPGVFARNLALSRKISGHAVSYIETLFYNNPAEFAALSKADQPLLIDGVNHPYSARLFQVVEALRDGVTEFVRDY